jgi:hypothetical protein
LRVTHRALHTCPIAGYAIDELHPLAVGETLEMPLKRGKPSMCMTMAGIGNRMSCAR